MTPGKVQLRWFEAAKQGEAVQSHPLSVLNLKTGAEVVAAVKTAYVLFASMAAEMPKPDAGGTAAGGEVVDYEFPTP